jgi:hypothetical protein
MNKFIGTPSPKLQNAMYHFAEHNGIHCLQNFVHNDDDDTKNDEKCGLDAEIKDAFIAASKNQPKQVANTKNKPNLVSHSKPSSKPQKINPNQLDLF